MNQDIVLNQSKPIKALRSFFANSKKPSEIWTPKRPSSRYLVFRSSLCSRCLCNFSLFLYSDDKQQSCRQSCRLLLFDVERRSLSSYFGTFKTPFSCKEELWFCESFFITSSCVCGFLYQEMDWKAILIIVDAIRQILGSPSVSL